MHDFQYWYPLIQEYTPRSYITPLERDLIDKMLDVSISDEIIGENLSVLYPSLDEIFTGCRWFVRVSSCSPKDILDQYDDENISYMESIDRNIEKLAVHTLYESISLLRKSERIRDALVNCTSTYIVWREWKYVSLQCEYRCFVKGNQLRGISQYVCMEPISNPIYQYTESLIRDRTLSFWREHIQERMGSIGSYVMDVCLSPDDIYVIEINGWEENTDGAMFSWYEDILSSDVWNKEIEVRLYYDGYLDKWISV